MNSEYAYFLDQIKSTVQAHENLKFVYKSIGAAFSSYCPDRSEQNELVIKLVEQSGVKPPSNLYNENYGANLIANLRGKGSGEKKLAWVMYCYLVKVSIGNPNKYSTICHEINSALFGQQQLDAAIVNELSGVSTIPSTSRGNWQHLIRTMGVRDGVIIEREMPGGVMALTEYQSASFEGSEVIQLGQGFRFKIPSTISNGIGLAFQFCRNNYFPLFYDQSQQSFRTKKDTIGYPGNYEDASPIILVESSDPIPQQFIFVIVDSKLHNVVASIESKTVSGKAMDAELLNYFAFEIQKNIAPKQIFNIPIRFINNPS